MALSQSQSIGGYFKDENYKRKHNCNYLLSMVNLGKPNTNGSQFIIALEAPWLHGKQIAFGQAVSGTEIMQLINVKAGSWDGKPKLPAVITKSRTCK